MNNYLPERIWSQIEEVGGENRADLCLKLSYSEFENNEFSHSKILCQAALDIYSKLDESVSFMKISSAYKGLVRSLSELNAYSEAAEISLEAANYLENFDDSESRIALESAAENYYQMDQNEKSLEIYLRITSNPLNILSEFEYALYFIHIAYCHIGMKQFSLAIDYLQKSRMLLVLNAEPKLVAIIDEELSECYFEDKKVLQAIEYARKALDYAILMNDKRRLERSHQRMGFAAILSRSFDSSLSHFKRAKELMLSETNPDIDFILMNEKGVALVLQHQNRITESQAILKRIANVQQSMVRKNE